MANAINRARTTDKEYKISADHVPYVAEDDCIACGACEEICPEVFTVNESLGFAQVMNPSGAPAAKIQEAVDACPVNCIHWADEAEQPGVNCGATHDGSVKSPKFPPP